ncbi:unnamed protein product [Alternaria alternata]
MVFDVAYSPSRDLVPRPDKYNATTPTVPVEERQRKGFCETLYFLDSSSACVSAISTSSRCSSTGLASSGEGTNPVIDIVAVHGLNGHCEKTWTAGNGIDSVNWLRDLLPHDLPNARILSWGYDANTHSGSRVSCQYLFDHARTLVSDLCLERQITETSKRPIIFVAHSLGGIIVKSALIHSDAARRGALEEHRAVKLSTYGILFMGTPHQGGSGVALGKLMVNVASLGQYGPISSDFVTKFAFEEYATPTVLGKSIMVVPRASAVVPGAADGEPIAIHADHINMVKFESKSDPGYKTVSGHLRLMAARAGDAIDQRWDTEGRVDAVRFNRVVASFAVQSSVPEVSHVERSVGRQEQLLREHFHQQTQILNSLEIKIQQVSHQMRNRPKELGYPWETGVSEDQLKVDDGLGAEYLLPTELCGTPEGTTFRDYSELALPCVDDPYFNQFGGYNAFWALLHQYLPKLYDHLGGPISMTDNQLAYGYVDLGRMEEQDKGAVRRIAEDYWFEVVEAIVDQGMDISPDIAADFSKEKTRREPETKKKDFGSGLDEMAIRRMRDEFAESSMGIELKEIKMGNWNGVPHWLIED